MKWRTAGMAIVSLALAGGRIAGEKGEIFQAMAHLWVGGLVGGWIGTRDRAALGLAVLLSLVELTVFFVNRL